MLTAPMLTVPMLTVHAERYVSLRQALGFKLRDVTRQLRAYARYAEARGDAHIRSSTAGARHVVALATYMGHTDIAHTYWYLEATPELMADIAAAGEALVTGGTAP